MSERAPGPNNGFLIGVDVGGTFTDVVLATDTGELVRCLKVPSSQKVADAVVDGIRQALDREGLAPSAVTRLLHGTTVATNAILEKKGARVGLLTTKGFRDVLEIGRQIRPEIYNLFTRRPEPLVRRAYRREVAERVRADGSVQLPLDPGQVKPEVEALLADGVESIAICLLFSFLRPEHERALKSIVHDLCPDFPVTVSSELIPVFKEYERTSTTVVNAYVLPAVGDYIRLLERAVSAAGFSVSVETMQSNGGTMSTLSAAEKPVHLVLSGPAGGVVAARTLSQRCGEQNLIAIDIGGTSTDVCLLEGGTIPLTTEGEIAGYPISVPMVPIHTVGAGGGSIAWVDSGGAVRMGPQSAGSEPGPACYGRGGKDATITDAALVLGRLNPKAFAGNITLDPEAARAAIRTNLATPLGTGVEEAAERAIKVGVANVVRAIRLVSVDKGHDPRNFSLLAYGGAGPLLAAEVSEALEMKKVFVPPYPGNFSALGLLVASIKHDATRSVLSPLDRLAAGDLAALVSGLASQAAEMLRHDVGEASEWRIERVASLRYVGQSYEIELDLSGNDGPGAIAMGFHQAHQARYGFCVAQGAIELVNLRVTASAGGADITTTPQQERTAGKPSPYATRMVYHGGRADSWPIYRRQQLSAGSRIPGPAIVEEDGSTTVVLSRMTACVDSYGNIVVESPRKEEPADARRRAERRKGSRSP